MGGMQQQGKWEIWAGWRLCLLFCLPDLHHSRDLEPLGSRGAPGESAAVQHLAPGRRSVSCWVFSGQHFASGQASMPAQLQALATVQT